MSLTPEQHELGKIIAASFAETEAREAARRQREGEVVLCLERATDDPQPDDAKYQEELRAFAASLRATGLKFSQRAIAFDLVDGGGYPLPEFVIVI